MSGYIGDFIIDVKNRKVKPGDIFWIDSPIHGHIRVKAIEFIDDETVLGIELKSHIPEIKPMSHTTDYVNQRSQHEPRSQRIH